MRTLRVTQISEGPGQYRAEVRLEGDGLAPHAATAHFQFEMTPQEHEDLRWYLEDFLQHPHDPAPKIAGRVEKWIQERGVTLFKAVFQGSDDARDLWATLRVDLSDTRVEIITTVEEATSIPWELLRDPKTDTPLALRARVFTRAQPEAAQRPKLPPVADSDEGPIRILLVICRPGADEDVPFRSVASRLIKGLGEDARKLFQLDVLRPPTFEQLGRVLRAAKADGRPYHVVHFDGHGMYAEIVDSPAVAKWLRSLIPLLLAGPREGPHGYLLFENPKHDENVQPVDGTSLGKLLVETGVTTLVLNACRSAHAEQPATADEADSKDAAPQAAPKSVTAEAPGDPHGRVRALGSLAQEVMDQGVAGVVAMRYNVYVVTAAQFVADLYAALTQGRSLGEAVTLGRKQLAASPQREIAFEPRALQDWSVPVVYEAAPIKLFPEQDQDTKLSITLDADRDAAGRGALDEDLPKRPDVGFFGRDETLLALDRAFDTQHLVLLHAFAGSGKTATAAEFARWYALTGGVAGPVLFTSFEQYQPLARVLDQIGQAFGHVLEQTGVNWLALDDAARRDIALQVLKQLPVLWIWDNVEPIAGFPAGSDSPWSAEEQTELADFLRDARETKARFLLTSRRDERTWLGELPRRIPVPPMPMQERVQLARGLAEKHGQKLIDVGTWRPLLRFTGGNPLTITVLVGQALRDGRKTREQISEFVNQLRAGEARFEDEAAEGRSKSLGASLSYGLDQAFTDDERRQLALLHLFQGFVDVDTLEAMGHPKADWCLEGIRGLEREHWISLLDRAAEIGLLTAHGDGYYTIHPALPWFFKGLFDAYYTPGPDPQASGSDLQSEISNLRLRAARAFVEAIGELGNYYHSQYDGGKRDVIDALKAQEANLLHARQLARTHGMWRRVISTMRGLDVLHQQTGRRPEWARLVAEIVPDFVDPATDGPLPGREGQWSLVTGYRVLLARQARRWTEAERLQRVLVDWARQQAAAALQAPREALDEAQRNAIQSLAVSLNARAEIQRELQQSDCVATYKEGHDLALRIDDRQGAVVTALNLGLAYKNVPVIRDLERAERWCRRALELTNERDRLYQGKCHLVLGNVALQRFDEARAANKPKEQLLDYLNSALESYQQALQMAPADAPGDLAVAHNALGSVFYLAADLDRALPHYREAIRYQEIQRNLYGAGGTRFNVALALGQAGRFADALDYAQAALRNYETYGEGAAEDVERTRALIVEIKRLQAQGG
ncbi:MAG TPA: CHAT domain-containing protein [Phycisphaerae bacterium]|nr:CHAT domain-containing protein [Phycisphaerae bacterium]